LGYSGCFSFLRSRSHAQGRASKIQKKEGTAMNPDLLRLFLDKTVQIKVENFIVSGKLYAFHISELNSTCILLLQSKNGFMLMKDFETLGELEIEE
jgi:hypothetical protein